LKYHIYKKTVLGTFKEIAQTVFLEDAKQVLAQYNAGYIQDNFDEILIMKDNKEKN